MNWPAVLGKILLFTIFNRCSSASPTFYYDQAIDERNLARIEQFLRDGHSAKEIFRRALAKGDAPIFRFVFAKNQELGGDENLSEFFYDPKFLVYTVMENNVELVQELLEKGADPNGIYEEVKATPLTIAIRNGSLPIIRLLVSHGVNVNALPNFDQGLSPLIEAVKTRNLEVTRAILAAGAKPDLSDNFRATPLMYAVSRGSVDIVEELLKESAEVDLEDHMGRTALAFLASNTKAIAELLVKYGASVNHVDNCGWTALMELTEHNQHRDIETIRFLHFHGAEFDLYNNRGHNCLSLAVSRSQIHSSIELIRLGANVHIFKHPNAPIFLALKMEMNSVVELIFRKLGGPGRTDAEGRRLVDKLLMVAAHSRGHREVQGLLELGGNVNFTDHRGRTPLIVSIESEHFRSTETLLQAGADANCVNASGIPALILAVRRNSEGTVNSLLEKGADPDSIDPESGETALIVASKLCNTIIAKSLLVNQANVDVRDREGSTALMFACLTGNYEIAKLLIDNCADINIENEQGQSPWSFVRQHRMKKWIRLLAGEEKADAEIERESDD